MELSAQVHMYRHPNCRITILPQGLSATFYVGLRSRRPVPVSDIVPSSPSSSPASVGLGPPRCPRAQVLLLALRARSYY